MDFMARGEVQGPCRAVRGSGPSENPTFPPREASDVGIRNVGKPDGPPTEGVDSRPTMQLNLLDWGIVILSLLVCFAPALWYMRRAGSSSDEFFGS